jgi:hypothetical protein
MTQRDVDVHSLQNLYESNETVVGYEPCSGAFFVSINRQGIQHLGPIEMNRMDIICMVAWFGTVYQKSYHIHNTINAFALHAP